MTFRLGNNTTNRTAIGGEHGEAKLRVRGVRALRLVNEALNLTTGRW